MRPGRFWLAWPRASAGRGRDDARREDCLGLTTLLAGHAPVTVLANYEDVVAASLSTPQGVGVMGAVHDGSPLSLGGPLFLVDEEGFLAGKLAGHTAAAAVVGDCLDVPAHAVPGGLPPWALDTDGEGTALVAERASASCNLEPAEAERLLAESLGIEKVIWVRLPQGMGSVRAAARFLKPGLVAVSVDRGGPAAPDLEVTRAGLAAARDAAGRPLKTLELPLAKKGGSYTDALLAGSLVVVPEFEDRRDQEAFDLLVGALPDRKVVAAPAVWLAPPSGGLGSIVLVQPAMRG